ncbi:MAG: hypothetical protein PS018_04965 [bacterium]|nr:hypothetical protein [bacterium]
MSNECGSGRRHAASTGELTEDQLERISGGFLGLELLHHAIKSPRDAASGLATGRRSY